MVRSSARALALVTLFAWAPARGALITWDNGSGDKTWSNSANWDPNGAATGNDLTFTSTGTAAAGTVTNVVDATISANTLSYLNSGAGFQTTQIANGQTLTITGAAASAFNVGGNSVTLSTSVAVTGASGSLAVNGGSGATFTVGAGIMSGAGAAQTLDLSGLGSFAADVGTFGVGTGQRNSGTVSLAATNSITTTTLSLGGNVTTGGNPCSVNLGLSNTVNADTLNLGGGRTAGNMLFRSGLNSPTVTIANRAGTGATNVNIGSGNTSASGIGGGSLDVSGGTVTAMLGTVTIGVSANIGGGGNGVGSLVFGAGSITSGTMNIGSGNTGSVATATGVGTVTMNVGSGTLSATVVNLGRQVNSSGVNAGSGTFSQNGGMAAITTLTMGDRASTTTTGTVTSAYNLTGGVFKAQAIQAGRDGTGGGTVSRTFTWTSGTIQNLDASTNLTIAGSNALTITLAGSGTRTFAVDSGRTATVQAVLSGSDGFLVKTGAGTLTLTGTNTYSGTTTVSAGTLYANTPNSATGGLASTAAITIASGATLRSSANALFGWTANQGKDITVNAGGVLTADAGADVHVGRVILAGGTLTNLGSSTDWGSWVFDGSSTLLSATADSTVSAVNVRMQNGAAIDVASGRTLNFTGSITDTTLGGTSSLIKTGTGTLLMAGSNSYTGSTTVSAGGLIVNGVLGSGTLSVAAASWLTGSGTILGPVAMSGTLSPGSSPGLLALKSLSLDSTSTTVMEINGSTAGSSYDSILINDPSGLVYGGSLQFSFGTTLADNTTLDLFSFTGTPAGTFTSVTATGTYGSLAFTKSAGVWTAQSGSQTLSFTEATGDVIIVPEPSVVALLGCGAAAALARSRRRIGRSANTRSPSPRG